jgi:5-methylcytosine-specific restriction endonuclease McrA
MNIPSTQADALDALARRTLAHHKSRAKMVGQTLDYDAGDLRRLIADSPCCRWCKLPISFADLQLDHLHPIARGGRFALWNTTGACSRCNQLRGLLTEGETEELREFLGGLHPVAREDIERRLLAGGRVFAGGRAKL